MVAVEVSLKIYALHFLTSSQEVGEKMAKTGHWTLRTSCMNSGTANWSNIGSWLTYTLGNFSSKIPIWIHSKTLKIHSWDHPGIHWRNIHEDTF